MMSRAEQIVRDERFPARSSLPRALVIAAQRWFDNDAPSRAAAIAFFATFALVPMSVLVLQVAAFL
ncbi:MAG: hypothetical protein EAZ21_11250 [Betaproteobacteria bacterium]|nr:MAG: hypothetical protein EAZ21_11250 [Betaproteobacteria bacterium]